MKRIAGVVAGLALLLAGCGPSAGDAAPSTPVDWRTTPTNANELMEAAPFTGPVSVRYLVSAGNAPATYAYYDAEAGDWSPKEMLAAGSTWESDPRTTDNQVLMLQVDSTDFLDGEIQCAIEVDGKILVHLAGKTTFLCTVSGKADAS